MNYPEKRKAENEIIVMLYQSEQNICQTFLLEIYLKMFHPKHLNQFLFPDCDMSSIHLHHLEIYSVAS